MEQKVCPLCGSLGCEIERHSWYVDDNTKCAEKISCKQGFTFIVHDDVNYGNSAEIKRRYNLIRSILLHTPTKNIHGFEHFYKFYYEESEVGKPIEDPDKVNLASNMRSYPHDVISRIESVLVNLSMVYPSVGQPIYTDSMDATLFYCESNDINAEISGIFSFLQELGYLTQRNYDVYIISASGWKKIFDLRKYAEEINQGFIAMSFASEAKYIGDIFSKVINSCGYIPRIINQKEHNNQIVPEIFYEISRSKFVVVDVTYPNYGAYYEAGYGEALKKQVIVCCKKDIFDGKNRPHFDISQKSAVIWADEDDLEKKLKRRIEATVGIQNNCLK